MRAESIEQIREHLARGGRVTNNVGDITLRVLPHSDKIRVVSKRKCEWQLTFANYTWELLPIEEEKVDIAKLPRSIPMPSREEKIWDKNRGDDGNDPETIDAWNDYMGKRLALRNKLMFGQPWTMDEQREVWELLTGERIEWGRRCEKCNGTREIECTQYMEPPIKMLCPFCGGKGYTVRPTWMGEVKG